IAGYYHSAVSGNKGAGIFTGTIQQYCDCVCDDPKLTACQDKCVDTKTDPENCGSCNFHVSPYGILCALSPPLVLVSRISDLVDCLCPLALPPALLHQLHQTITAVSYPPNATIPSRNRIH